MKRHLKKYQEIALFNGGLDLGNGTVLFSLLFQQD
jgi:hypothetical protein